MENCHTSLPSEGACENVSMRMEQEHRQSQSVAVSQDDEHISSNSEAWDTCIKMEPQFDEGYNQSVNVSIENLNHAERNDCNDHLDGIKEEPNNYSTEMCTENDIKKEIDDDSNASSTELYSWNGNQLPSNEPEPMVMYIQTNMEDLGNEENSNVSTISQNKRKRKGTKPQRRKSIEKEVEMQAYTCTICDERFRRKIDLKKHARVHANTTEYVCKICDKQFKKKIELKKHERNHRGPKKYTCEVCGKVCTRKTELNGHMRTHTKEKPYLCPICGKGFGFAHHLKGHLITHTDEKPYICEVCGRGFNDRSSMRRHVKLHQNKEEDQVIVDENGEKRHVPARRSSQNFERTLVCEHCGKAFYKAQHLKVHIRIHTGEKPHQCDDCGKLFNDPSSLRRHRKTYAGRPHILKEDKIKQYKCPICEKEFSYSRNFRYHVNRHSDEKSLECTTCGKKYHTNHHLRQHMKSHAADKPYKCAVCEKRFGTYSMWYCHTRTHKGGRKVQCEICYRYFLTGGHLKAHMTIHKGKEPHNCVECGKTFSLNSLLKRHVLMAHIDGKKIECKHCGKVCEDEITLNQHLFLEHADEFENEDLSFNQSDHQDLIILDDNSNDQKNDCPEVGSTVSEGKSSNSDVAERENIFSQFNLNDHVTASIEKVFLESNSNSTVDVCMFTCKHCNKQFNDKDEMQDHVLSHSGLNLHQCPYCDKKFTKKLNFRKHVEAHHEKTGFIDIEFENSEEGLFSSEDREYIEKEVSSLVTKGNISIENKECSKKEVRTEVQMSSDGVNPAVKHTEETSPAVDPQSSPEKKPYACTECDKSFKEKRYLTEHFRFHTGLNLHECEICGKKFTSKSHFKKHLETHSDVVHKMNVDESEVVDLDGNSGAKFGQNPDGHNSNTCDMEDGSKLYTCSCGKSFKEKHYLSQHFKIHTRQNFHECDICGMTFSTKANLLAHSKTHDDSDLSSKDLNSSDVGQTNDGKSQDKPYACTECGRCFKEKRYLAEHFRFHTGEDLHVCKICNKQFTKKSHFKRHIQIHKDYPKEETQPSEQSSPQPDDEKRTKGENAPIKINNTKPYQCPQCDRSFIDRGSLTIHFKIHTGIDLHECEICDKKFTKKPNFLRHLQSHMALPPLPTASPAKEIGNDISLIDISPVKSIEELKPYACTECDKRFTEKSSLSIHFRFHTGLNLLECEICGKKFAKRYHYNRHIESHNNENQYNSKSKPYPCSECNKSFSDKGSLSTHFRIHTGINVRECDVCGKRFTKNYNFMRHLKIHTGDKPYVCTYCGKGFGENNGLARHVKTKHSGLTPFNCHLCSEGFVTEFSLDKHLKTHTEKSNPVPLPEITERDIIRENMAPSELIQEIINEMMDGDETQDLDMNFGLPSREVTHNETSDNRTQIDLTAVDSESLPQTTTRNINTLSGDYLLQVKVEPVE